MSLRCPTLSELPAPPPGRSGWPWTVESPIPLSGPPAGTQWPVVSVVTPSYNQAPYLEETLRSVLLQGYPALEYVVIDGASGDGSVELIRKYEPWLAYWASEVDRGQSHAINKGFAQTHGTLLAWLNSDDVYEPQALFRAAAFHNQHQQYHLIYGSARTIGAHGEQIGIHEPKAFDLAYLAMHCHIAQDATFFSRAAWQAVGPLDESFQYAMDYDLWLRMVARFQASRMPGIFSSRRLAPGTKTVEQPENFWPEIIASAQRFYALSDLPAAVRATRGRALSLHNLHASAHYMRAGRIPEGHAFLAAAFENAPVLARQPEEFARIIVSQGRTPNPCEIAPYVNRIFDNLPPPAAGLLPLRAAVRQRIAVLSLARYDPAHVRGWVLRNLPGLLRDYRWTTHPQVSRMLLRLSLPVPVRAKP